MALFSSSRSRDTALEEVTIAAPLLPIMVDIRQQLRPFTLTDCRQPVKLNRGSAIRAASQLLHEHLSPPFSEWRVNRPERGPTLPRSAFRGPDAMD